MDIMNMQHTENEEEVRMSPVPESIPEQPMAVAADSLVHFAEGPSPLYQELEDQDGVVAAEVARTAYLCMTEAVS